MNRLLRWSGLVLAGVSLVIAGCGPSVPTESNPSPTPLVLNLPSQAIETATVPPTEPSPFASFEGLVWDDQDRDGLQDLQEKGLPNVTVNLLTGTRTPAGTTTTNNNGAYQFTGLVPGDYFVNLQPPPGYVFSPQDQGMNELVDSDTYPATTETAPVSLVSGENGLVFTTGVYSPTAPVMADSGTVKPPPAEINVCAAGTYPLGGTSTLQVDQLAPGYCLHAFLWNHAFAIGRIPDGAGRVLSNVTFVEFFYQGTFVYEYEAAGETNSVQVCHAVPTGMQAQIYFFDHYGPRFGHPHQGQPSWVPLPTTVQNGVACAVAQTSGAYALIGK